MYMKMSSFYTCVSKITIIWCMLPEIWVQHTIFCQFGSFFAILPHYWSQKLKIKKKIRRYFLLCMCTINKDSWDIRRNRQKFLSFWVIFFPFIPLRNQKTEILKKWKKKKKKKKKPWRYYHFTFVYHEWQSYDLWFLRYGVQQTKSFLILDHFLSFSWKIKILKKEVWRYHEVPLVSHKWQSYDVWFVRYKVQGTESFGDYFLPFWPPWKHVKSKFW